MADNLEASIEHKLGVLAKPLHIQRIEQAVQLGPFLNYVESLFSSPFSDGVTDTDGCLESEVDDSSKIGFSKLLNGIVISKAERRAVKARLYNFSKVKKSRRWLKNLLLSDSSESSDEDGQPITDEEIQHMLRLHKERRVHQENFYSDRELQQYQYYSTGLLSYHDRFYEHQKLILGPRKKTREKKLGKKMKAKLKKMKLKGRRAQKYFGDDEDDEEQDSLLMDEAMMELLIQRAVSKKKGLSPTEASVKRRKIWMAIAKKEIPKAQKQKVSAHNNMLTNARKIAQSCQKECRKVALQSQRLCKETPQRARRLTREMLLYWKRYEKVEKEHRKRAEKEAMEQRKMDIELREAKRQQRKLNFLITQTELYAHFMSRKIMGETVDEQLRILSQLEDKTPRRQLLVVGGVVVDTESDDYDSEKMKALALKNAEDAYMAHQYKTKAFDIEVAQSFKGKPLQDAFDASFTLSDPSFNTEQDRLQPKIFHGKLKTYQLKGMNWLANLYDQGINGILADEMGLGKTVQSIAFLAHIAESQSIWGPFLIIAPASTLHNWQQEFVRFVPKFKVLPYWGNTSDRKILRKFWNQKDLHTEDASFHILITSYQLVVQDVKYFQRIKWQYMVLDEAQAIKSSSSVRWKILLGFSCRNRLLLSGTPIQNSMAELWALLHFIMPTLFDSHEEFNEWFSKDIESHAENKSFIDENQLSRLHLILKPFMLRRIKKDVENELSDKIEIHVSCHLTTRQRHLYKGLKNKISIEDLLHSSMAANTSQAQSTTSSLMNLVMQFRKVCNHPELFERREVKSPVCFPLESFLIPKLLFRNGILEKVNCSKQKLLLNTFNIFNVDHIHCSLYSGKIMQIDCFFSFLRFIDMSAAEMFTIMHSGLLVRWLSVFLTMKAAYRIYHQHVWESKEFKSRYLHNKAFLLCPLSTTSSPSVQSSTVLQHLVFTSYTGTIFSHCPYILHYIPETIDHRDKRLRKATVLKSPSRFHPTSPNAIRNPVSPSRGIPLSPLKKMHTPSSSISDVSSKMSLLDSYVHRPRPPKIFDCHPTPLPCFVYYLCPKVYSPPLSSYCSDRSFAWEQFREAHCGSLEGKLSLVYGSPEFATEIKVSCCRFFPCQPGGLIASKPVHGWSNIQIPDKETMVTDSGKLYILDVLLTKLKCQGHRVLIYSQMTRMIDLLEEYMWHRKHTYMRLDGSSKISDRRDMVADFQTRSDIFVFLLSTRAGGLGINLTAADTVIFYDSDWNPTVDQQAMDRAHRLGQTKQVTVYRLICKGTIEERILQRAKEKSEIQRMVISGGNFKPDTLKPKEVVSLLLDDDELERKFKVRQEEKKHQDEQNKEKDRKRKREKYAEKVNQFQKSCPNISVEIYINRFSTSKNLNGDQHSDTVASLKKDGPFKKKRALEENITIPASLDSESVVSMDSFPASPYSEVSYCSASLTANQDDTSNEGSLIVDDNGPPNSLILNSTSSSGTPGTAQTSPNSKSSGKGKGGRGSGRGRGRPKGSGKGRGRGRGSTLAAAEMAGAQAGTSAAYAAYGFSFQSVTPSVLRAPGTSVTLENVPTATPITSVVSPNQSKVGTSLQPGFYQSNPDST